MTKSPGASYVEDRRQHGVSDSSIRKKLQDSGWSAQQIDAAFQQVDDPTPPPPPSGDGIIAPPESNDGQPLTVVHRSSTVGIEYGVMVISLAIGATTLGAAAHSYLNVVFGQSESFSNPLAIAGALTAIPTFTLLFMRLKRMERRNPAVRDDSSRRRWIQLALLTSFLIGMGHIIYYVYNLINGNYDPYASSYYYDYRPQLSAGAYQLLQFGHLAVTLAIAGSIFAYFWMDEHKQKQ